MLENRSFDHMLGYLSLPEDKGGAGRADVDGLKGDETNAHDGTSYGIHHLDRTAFSGEAEDPDHSSRSVDEQLKTGFVAKLRAHLRGARAHKLGVPVPDPGLVMGLLQRERPSCLRPPRARSFCVVDRWFQLGSGSDLAEPPLRRHRPGRPGPATTSPRRCMPCLHSSATSTSVTSAGAGTRSIRARWRAIDPAYRLSSHHRFSYFDTRKLSTARRRAVGELLGEDNSFLDDVAPRAAARGLVDRPTLQGPARAWPGLERRPPAIRRDRRARPRAHPVPRAREPSAAVAEKRLLIITYDEHGGFYDHVIPPRAVDEHHDFPAARRASPRAAGVTTARTRLDVDGDARRRLPLRPRLDHQDDPHALLQSERADPGDDGRASPPQTTSATCSPARPATTSLPTTDLAQRMQDWRATWAEARFADPMAVAAGPRKLTDFQSGFYDMARRLRHAGLPAAHP